MDQLCTSGSAADRPVQEQPFADERDRYLSHCVAVGARPAVLKVKRNELLWIARRLRLDAEHGVGMTELMAIALERQNLHGADHRCAEGHRYRATVAAVPRLVAGT
jgi:integrase/recombinase XerD